jgi:AraC-like DNA-binding protein
MKEHCSEQHLSLGEVADHVYVSQWHLSKLLNRETGQSFFDLLGSLRIGRAKELLADPRGLAEKAPTKKSASAKRKRGDAK